MADNQRIGEDAQSYANFSESVVTQLDLDLKLDFSKKIFSGFVDVTAKIQKSADRLYLDSKFLEIKRVLDLDSSAELQYDLNIDHPKFGKRLAIFFSPVSENTSKHIRVEYNTTAQSGGVQWLEPSQTEGKKHPYVYTQFEAIFARTFVPCQDTPAVKSPYSIKLNVPEPLIAACSGSLKSDPVSNGDGTRTFHYEQLQPIPAYLIALVCGDLVKEKLGSRSSVWSEPSMIKACVHEFQQTETYLKLAEEITGVPYQWPVYDMVVLPGSFPFGGMENVQLTFLSKSLIAGDRSLATVVAHEIVHSWAGNLVTNKSWTDFWLNEGFTVYIERLIAGALATEAYRHFEIYLGYQGLVKAVAEFGEANKEYTKLQPNTDGKDPDEVFSRVPYEKGSLLLFHLEHHVGGKDKMQRWLKSYFSTFKTLSITTAQMRQHFANHFVQHEGLTEEKINAFDWNTWLHGTGLPPVNFDLLDKTEIDKCESLAKKWKEGDGKECTSEDLKSLTTRQKMAFLDILLNTAMPMKPETLQHMNKLYTISETTTADLVYRWILMNLKSKVREVIPLADNFLSLYGRGLFVKPIYKALYDLDQAETKRIYNSHRSFYHYAIQHNFDSLLKN